MSEKRLYPKCAELSRDLAKYLSAKYEAEGFETQILSVEREGDEGRVFQMRPKDSAGAWFKKWTGMEKAATVKMKSVGDALEVEVGGGKWLDKAAALGVSMIVLWPLTITALIGTFGQRSLLKQVLDDVDAFFRQGATVPKCPECEAEISVGARYCSECGKAIGQQA